MSQENFVIEELVKELVLKILDTRTGLYSQSTAFVYDYIDSELTTGKLQ